MVQIHPTAFVDAQSELAADVRIGPFCHVGPGVRLGRGCELISHVALLGPAQFGEHNVFYPQCTLGAAPQDLKYKGGDTRLVVGDHNIFRESVTVHRGTEVDRQSGGVTRIGDHNLLMVGAHVAHDAHLGSHIILANAVLIAGHVRIEDCVNVGGATAMHHFVTVGRMAFIGGMTRITHDVPPFMKVIGYDQDVRGVNIHGMRRWQIPDASVRAMKEAARIMYARRGGHSPLRTADALAELESGPLYEDACVRYFCDFIRRKLAIGIYGRAREHFRTDSFADRAAFYLAGSQGSDE